jgi:hypothetical protein
MIRSGVGQPSACGGLSGCVQLRTRVLNREFGDKFRSGVGQSSRTAPDLQVRHLRDVGVLRRRGHPPRCRGSCHEPATQDTGAAISSRRPVVRRYRLEPSAAVCHVLRCIGVQVCTPFGAGCLVVRALLCAIASSRSGSYAPNSKNENIVTHLFQNSDFSGRPPANLSM